MANENYPLNHVVVPVLRPDTGKVDSIAVPENTPITDLHSALSDYYHEQPTSQGAVENSPAFKQAAQQAWKNAGEGGSPWVESGFGVSRTGVPGKINVQVSPPHTTPKDSITVNSNDLGVVHTHPDVSGGQPSPQDIAAAKQVHKFVWVASKDGLWSVSPHGEVTRVFNKSDWMKH